jgi:hypothetical protein
MIAESNEPMEALRELRIPSQAETVAAQKRSKIFRG